MRGWLVAAAAAALLLGPACADGRSAPLPTRTPTPSGPVTPVPGAVPTPGPMATGPPPKREAPRPSPALRLVGPGVDAAAQWSWEGARGTAYAAQAGEPRTRLAAAIPVVVPTGTHLRLVFARSPGPESVTAVRWVGDRAEPVPLDPDGALVVGSDPGAFVYEMHAAWPGVEGVYAVRLEATGTAPPGDASRCRSADLELSVQGPVSEPTGQHTLPLALTNRSARTCSLLGYPTVALLDAGGRELPFVYRRGGDQVVTSRPPGRVDLAPGGAAHATVNKYRCDLGNRGAAAAVTLTLPDDPSPLRLALPPDAILLAYCAPGSSPAR